MNEEKVLKSQSVSVEDFIRECDRAFKAGQKSVYENMSEDYEPWKEGYLAKEQEILKLIEDEDKKFGDNYGYYRMWVTLKQKVKSK